MDTILFRKISKLGFSVFPQHGGGQAGLIYNVCCATIPSQDELVAVLELLSPAYRIEFFDAYFPAEPDDGSLAAAVVIKPGTVAYWYGDLSWRYVPSQEFAALLQMNWRKGDEEGNFKNCFRLVENR